MKKLFEFIEVDKEIFTQKSLIIDFKCHLYSVNRLFDNFLIVPLSFIFNFRLKEILIFIL